MSQELVRLADAELWAREFARNAAELPWRPGTPDFEDWIRTWFANAIMCGYDAARSQLINSKELVGVIPPLVFDGTTLSIPRATASQDGYLHKDDFVVFAAGGTGVGTVTQIDVGTGLAIVGGGPITDAGTIVMADIPGVEGLYFNPQIQVNAQGQIISIVSTTGGDITPPVISNVHVSSITTTSAIIMWDTDDPSDSHADYGTTTSYGLVASSSSFVTTGHTLPISSLLSGQVYHFKVTSTNASAETATGTDVSFTTLAVVDTTAPVLSAETATPSHTSVVITWTTDEAADSQVNYGTTSGYGTPTLITQTGGVTTGHSVTITGLTPSQTYHYQCKSRDLSPAQNLGLSVGDHSFTTLPPAPDLLDQLVSYWKMDTSTGLATGDTTPDEVGDNDFTLFVATSGAITIIPSEVSPSLGNELRVSTSGSTSADTTIIYSSDRPSQHFAGSFSIAGWLSIQGFDTAYSVVLAKTNAALGGGFSWVLGYNNVGNEWQFGVTADGATFVSALSMIPAVVANTPYFLVGIYDAVAHEIRLSINDGTPIVTPFPGTPYSSTQELYTTFPGNGIGYHSNCSVDEIGLWSKALSADEITALYNGGAGKTHPFT